MEIYRGLTKRVELLTYDLDMNETWAKHVTDFTTLQTAGFIVRIATICFLKEFMHMVWCSLSEAIPLFAVTCLLFASYG